MTWQQIYILCWLAFSFVSVGVGMAEQVDPRPLEKKPVALLLRIVLLIVAAYALFTGGFWS